MRPSWDGPQLAEADIECPAQPASKGLKPLAHAIYAAGGVATDISEPPRCSAGWGATL